MIIMKIQNDFYPSGEEELIEYCDWLKRKNSSALFLLEEYLGFPLSEDEKLSHIRKIILDVSGDISRIADKILDGDAYGRL